MPVVQQHIGWLACSSAQGGSLLLAGPELVRSPDGMYAAARQPRALDALPCTAGVHGRQRQRPTSRRVGGSPSGPIGPGGKHMLLAAGYRDGLGVRLYRCTGRRLGRGGMGWSGRRSGGRGERVLRDRVLVRWGEQVAGGIGVDRLAKAGQQQCGSEQYYSVLA